MRDRRLEVSVSFDERRGYVAHANGLPTITALSRRRINERLLCWPPLQARRGRIECGVDGGDHRVIGGRAGETGGDRLQEMIALYDRQRRRPALQQRELLVRERKGTRCDHVVFPQLA